MNRRQHAVRSIIMIAATVAVLFGISSSAIAATAPTSVSSGNGLSVDPVHKDPVIKPGESFTFDVHVTNVSAQPATFQVVINDFVARDETGNPALILNPNESAPTHSLRKFVTPIDNVSLQPGEKKTIKVTINIPVGTPAGGYFGAVRFTADSKDQAGKNVSLSASIAAPLILVKVPGNYKEVMSVESLDTRNIDKTGKKKDKIHSIFTKNKDISAAVRFKNSGDVQEQPFGKITVKNTGGKVVYSTEVNGGEDPGSVLPGSIRKFAVPLKNIGSFGKYTVQGDFGYGKGQTLTAKTTFYVIPLPVMIVLILLVIGVIVLIIEVPRMMKRYNRRVLRRAGK